MVFDPEIIRAAAMRFLTSRHPCVLLTVPGCGPCAISPVHWRSQDLHFAGARRLLVESEEQFVALVSWIATGKDPDTMGQGLQEALRQLVCYCGKVLSILALRRKECVHETDYSCFRDFKGALISLPGWEFNLIQEDSTDPVRRVYRVLRTHSRLLAEGPSPVFRKVTGLLEVRFVASEYLRLVIEGLPDEGHLTARVDWHGLSRPALIAGFKRQIPGPALPEYQDFDKDLQNAFAKPGRAEEILRPKARALPGDDDPSYPRMEIISSLLEPPPGEDRVTPEVIRERIRDTRARLWDAPTVAGHVRKQLDAKLVASALDQQFGDLPLSVQADLATLAMTLRKLEAGDFYLPKVA